MEKDIETHSCNLGHYTSMQGGVLKCRVFLLYEVNRSGDSCCWKEFAIHSSQEERAQHEKPR